MDIALCINFHREGLYARRSARSADFAVEVARSRGVDAGLIAILDRPDSHTERMVEESGANWTEVLTTDFGDLGEARNYAVQKIDASLIGFGDGDDLTGSSWLAEAHEVAQVQEDNNFVLHPEYVYYFSEGDFKRQSMNATPAANTESFFLRHKQSTDIDFDARLFWLNNLFTSNNLTSRALLIASPLPRRCLEHGFGVEDWTWNARTTWSGVRHLTVPKTVHLVRLKERGSLSAQNVALGLLPDLSDHWSTDTHVENTS